jgi:hypothetical protein
LYFLITASNVLKTFLDVLTKTNRTRNNSAQLTIFNIVNRCHALLTFALNCHSEGVIYARGRVVVFFAKYFSVNQIQVFDMKV